MTGRAGDAERTDVLVERGQRRREMALTERLRQPRPRRGPTSLATRVDEEVFDGVMTSRVTVAGPSFDDVLALRAEAYGTSLAGVADPVDDYSLHFVARRCHKIIGALRVTCHRDGPLESEQAYPRWILDGFGDKLCASSRMCVAPEERRNGEVALALTRQAWRTVLPQGIRIDVSKARMDATPFYLRLGYHLVRDSAFRFTRWDCHCALLAYPADPHHPGKISDLFTDIEDPCKLDAADIAERFTSSHREFLAMKRSLLTPGKRRDTNGCSASA